MLLPERTAYALTFYALAMTLLCIYKPAWLFRKDQVRPFGVGPDKTLLSLGTVTVALAVFSMALFTMIDVMGAPRAMGAPRPYLRPGGAL
jgi:hypothetical protein